MPCETAPSQATHGPVQHHDGTISVGTNNAVNKCCVCDVSACDDSGVDDEECFNSVKSQCFLFSSSTLFVNYHLKCDAYMMLHDI